MAWTEERVAVLKRMWTEGHSASQIAKSLGDVTRNAVIGKVHRLGLSGRATPSRPVKRPHRPKTTGNSTAPKPHHTATVSAKRNYTRPTPQRQIALKQAHSFTPSPEEAEAIALLERAASLEPLRQKDGKFASILSVEEKMCKWPIGDPTAANFALCGRPAKDGSPYCAEHSALAFQPARSQHKKTA